MNDARILVAGATGTNGRALLAALQRRGLRARALVRDLGRASDLASGRVELVQGDLADPDTLRAALAGIEQAYVVTAVGPDTVSLFGNFFAAAHEAGVEHVIKYSGLGASEDSPSEIIRQHGESDRMLVESGLAYSILRPNSFFQNMLWQAAAIRASGQFFLPLGDAKQSLVDVRDIADATAAIISEPSLRGRSYDLTGPGSLSCHDVATVLSEAIGRTVRYVPVPETAARTAMRDAGMSEWHARALAEIQALFGTGAYAEVREDLAKLLGRRPRSFADFAHDHADAFRP